MKRTEKQKHSPEDFDLDVVSSELDLFRWFLLVYLVGKPIQSTVARRTWQILVDNELDTPWSLAEVNRRHLVNLLDEGKYTRYDEKTATALKTCADQLIRMYDGSLRLLIDNSENEDECKKRLQELYGVGPKTAEIFLRGTTELFAQRVE